MELSIIFKDGLVELKNKSQMYEFENKSQIYEGSLSQICHELAKLHKMFIKDVCAQKAESLLKTHFQTLVRNIPLKGRKLKDIEYDLWEYVCVDSDIITLIETEIPCIQIMEDKAANNKTRNGKPIQFIAFLAAKKEFFNISLKATTSEIVVAIKRGDVIFEE